MSIYGKHIFQLLCTDVEKSTKLRIKLKHTIYRISNLFYLRKKVKHNNFL